MAQKPDSFQSDSFQPDKKPSVHHTMPAPAPPDTGIVAGAKRGLTTLTAPIHSPIQTGTAILSEAEKYRSPARGLMTMAQRVGEGYERMRTDGADPVSSAVAGGIESLPFVGPAMADFGSRVHNDDILGAQTEMSINLAGGKLLSKVPGAVAPKVRSAAQSLRTTPEMLLFRKLNPPDIEFQKYLRPAMDELKAGERLSGPVTSLETGKNALAAQTSVIHEAVDAMVEPQSNIVVGNSAQAIRRAMLAAIPDDIRVHKPKQYRRMVADIERGTQQDLTVGQLNNLRKELNATQSSFYGKDLTGQLTMDAGTRAIDIARGKAVRKLFYGGVDEWGLGGADTIRGMNQRLAAIMHMDDAFTANINKAAAESGMGHGARLMQTASRIGQPMKSLEKAARGELSTIDQTVKEAVSRWTRLPKEPDLTLKNDFIPGNRLSGGTRDPLGMSATGQRMAPHPMTGEMFPARPEVYPGQIMKTEPSGLIQPEVRLRGRAAEMNEAVKRYTLRKPPTP